MSSDSDHEPTEDTGDADDSGAAMKDTWSKVGENFAGLSEQLKRHYSDQSEVPGDTQEKVADALQSLGEAINRSVDAIGEAVRDPEVKDEARRASGSVMDAMAQTFDGVAEELRTRWQTRRDHTETEQ